MKDLVIIGAGSFGEEMLDNIRLINDETPTWNVVGFIDDMRTGEIDGVKILGTLEDFLKMDKSIQYFVAILDCSVRERIMNICRAAGFTGAVIICKEVVREENVVIGEGSYIGYRSNLLYGCRIGPGVILEQLSTLGSETRIDGYVSCRAFLSTGRCAHIKTHSTFDARCTVDDRVVVAEGCSFKIGTVVLKSVDAAGWYAGIPAKPVGTAE